MGSSVWTRDEIPYDAMGDYSMFSFDKANEEEHSPVELEIANEGQIDQ